MKCGKHHPGFTCNGDRIVYFMCGAPGDRINFYATPTTGNSSHAFSNVPRLGYGNAPTKSGNKGNGGRYGNGNGGGGIGNRTCHSGQNQRPSYASSNSRVPTAATAVSSPSPSYGSSKRA